MSRPVKEIEIENNALLCYPQSAPVMAATGKEHDVSLQAKGKMGVCDIFMEEVELRCKRARSPKQWQNHWWYSKSVGSNSMSS